MAMTGNDLSRSMSCALPARTTPLGCVTPSACVGDDHRTTGKSTTGSLALAGYRFIF
jgi:hypothetical protein